MSDNKNYYMEEPINESGIAEVKNPSNINSRYIPFKSTPIKTNVGHYFTKDSKYDPYIGNVRKAIEEDGLVVDDLRAKAQSTADMVANSLVNNLVIAGTTAVSGTIGLIDGIFEAIADKDSNKLWNNSVNNAMVDLQDASREAMPVYRGNEYQDKSIWGKMGTGIFWADLFQNLGFTEGMILPGVGVSKLLTSAPSIVSRVVPSVVSSIGEGSIEAINFKNEEIETKRNEALNRYKQLAESSNSNFALQILDSKFREEMDNIERDANTAGNFVLASNMALLSLTNTIEFGNLFSRGFKTSQRLKGALTRSGGKKAGNSLLGKFLEKGSEEVVYKAPSVAKNVTKATGKKLLDAFSEGMEEVSQGIISNIPSNYTEYNSFNESIFNTDKRELVSNLWSALGKSYADTLQDGATAEEFASGFITGLLGVPMLRKGRIPITLENSIFGEISNAKKEALRAQELAENINTRLNDNAKINSYYNGLVRHLSIQDSMNNAIDSENQYDFKTSESSQFISDIMMFDDAGDLDYLKSIINDSIDMSDEGIQNIIKETSKDGEGPFMDNGNPFDVDTVRETLKSKVEALNSKIDNYVKDKNSLQSMFPNIDDDTLSNALFLKQQHKDHTERLDTLSKEATSDINMILDSFYNFIPEGVEVGERMSFANNDTLLNYIGNTKNLKDLNDLIDENYSKSMTFDEKENLKKKLEDISKLQKGIETLDSSLIEVLSDTSKSKKDKEKLLKKKEKEEKDKKKKELEEELESLETVDDLENLYNDPNTDIEILDEALKEADKDSKASKINALNKQVESIKDVTKSLDEDSKDIADAILDDILLKEKGEKLSEQDVENLDNEEIKNVLKDNPDKYKNVSFDDDNLTKAIEETKYIIKESIKEIDKKEKERQIVDKDYKDPEPSTKPNVLAPATDTTGDSGTSTVESSNKTPTTTVTGFEEPISDTSDDAIKNDNLDSFDEGVEKEKNALDKLNGSDGGNKRYYRPAISKFDIASFQKPISKLIKFVEKNPSYRKLYNYLESKGAFDYVDDGNLSIGDEIGFMIDPESEASISDESWYNPEQPTIFLITTDKNGNTQIVGVLDGDTKAKNYVGLYNLKQRIYKDYKKHLENYKNSTSEELNDTKDNNLENDSKEPTALTNIPNFTFSETTKVSDIMIGKIDYSEDSRSLKDIDGVKRDSGKPIVFGIVKKGTIDTANTVPSSDIIKPRDLKGKEGRLYMFIPNAAGKYSPVAVRVKHFNRKEFNPDDTIVRETPIYKKINSLIHKLAIADSDKKVSVAVGELRDYLYIGNKQERFAYIEFWQSKDGKSQGLRFTKISRDSKGNRTDKEYEKTIYFTNKEDGSLKSTDEIKKEILDNLLDFDLPFQVNVGQNFLNNPEYMNTLIDSNVLTTNLNSARVQGSWFITDYFTNDGKLNSGVKPVYQSKKSDSSNTSNLGTRVTNNGKSYYVNRKSRAITDENGNNLLPYLGMKERIYLYDMAYIEEEYGSSMNGAGMIDGKVVLDGYRVFDRNSNSYLVGEEADKIVYEIFPNRRPTESNIGQEEDKKYPSSYSIFNPKVAEAIGDNYVDETKNEYKDPFPKESRVGFYQTEGSIRKGLMYNIGQVNGIDIYMTRVLEGDREMYYLVFPNSGNSFRALETGNPLYGVEGHRSFMSLSKDFIKMLETKPDKVKKLNDDTNTNIYKYSQDTTQDPNEALDDALNSTSQTKETKSDLTDTSSSTNSYSKAFDIDANEDFYDDEDINFRKTTSETNKVWDKEKELKWLDKVLPQLRKEERVQVVKGLIKVANSGATAWGQLKDGIVTLSDIAAEGTTYHEAFHVVFNLLLDPNERLALLNEAKEKYGNKSDLLLEEDLAEGFREYVVSQSSRGLGQRILDFFKNLYAKVTNWKYVSPTIDNYYRKINTGEYSNKKIKSLKELKSEQGIEDIIPLDIENLDTDIKDILKSKGWTQEMWFKISQEEREQVIKCYFV